MKGKVLKSKGNAPVRAAIYTRISDARNGETEGIDRQRADCLALCQKNGWEVVGVFEDNAVSAMKKDLKDRPQGRKLLALIKEGHVDVLVAWSVERIYRRVAELEYLIDAFAQIEVETLKSGEVDLTTADGRMYARMMGSVGQHASEKAGERIARAALQRAEQGKFIGGNRRFGYNETCTELIPEEAEAIKWAYKFIADGGSVRQATMEWRRRFTHGAAGGKINTNQVRTALLRPMNAGLQFYKGKEIGKSQAPTIIDEATWRRVHAILTDPTRRTLPGRPQKLLLSGVLRCASCGGKFSGYFKKRAGGTTRPVYRCTGCMHYSRSRVWLDANISEAVLAMIERQPLKILGTADNQDAIAKDLENAEIRRNQLRDLDGLMVRGEIHVADYGRMTIKIREEIAVIEERVARQSRQPQIAKLAQAQDIRQAWEDLSDDQRRNLINEVIDHILVTPAPVGNQATMEGIFIKWKTLPGASETISA